MERKQLLCWLIVAGGLALPGIAAALAARTFVSAALGNDANACTRLAPCRTFAVAITRTASGGEINMLDAGGYGPVIINKSISIVNDGAGPAGVLVAVTGGITVNAGATGVVNLRGLIVEGAHTGFVGIYFVSGKSLTIDHCIVRNLLADGIQIHPSGSASVTLIDTVVADNGGFGVLVEPTGAGSVAVAAERLVMHDNGVSNLWIDTALSGATIRATFSNTMSSGSGVAGYGVQANATPATLTIVGSTASNNVTGVYAAGTLATARLARSTVTDNGTGWTTSGGAAVLSYGDNAIDGNAAGNTAPPLIPTK